MLDLHTLGVCLLIVLGRIADVTLGTIRTIMVVRGYRSWASVLGFFEIIIWIFVVAGVIQGLSENLFYGVSYALGFAAGNYVGVTLDNKLALGKQVVQVFSRQGKPLAAALRGQGVPLTTFEGAGRDGSTTMLMVVTERMAVAKLLQEVRKLDPDCYYTVEDVHSTAAARAHGSTTGWRTILKRQ
ncbi:MAG TPA: DUF5698 domain-containing protein [Phycisphaerae bacterium]|nr:DUF5698 domain-containing protein [Phycisphaerae bacterium]